MSTKKPERWPAEQWRRTCPTIGHMLAKNWDITARCRKCALIMRVNLQIMALATGPDFDLWNQTTTCKRVDCGGTMGFYFRPPQLMQPQDMRASWPEEWALGQPGVFRSSAK